MSSFLSGTMPAGFAAGSVGAESMEKICRGSLLNIKRITALMLALAVAMLVAAYVLMYTDQAKQARAVFHSTAAVVVAAVLFVGMDAFFSRNGGFFRADAFTGIALLLATVLAGAAFFGEGTISNGWQLGLLVAAVVCVLYVHMYRIRVTNSSLSEVPKLPGYLGANNYDRFITQLDAAIDRAIFEGKADPNALRTVATVPTRGQGSQPPYETTKIFLTGVTRGRFDDVARAEQAVAAYLRSANEVLDQLLGRPADDSIVLPAQLASPAVYAQRAHQAMQELAARRR
jgi:hypothetical protein